MSSFHIALVNVLANEFAKSVWFYIIMNLTLNFMTDHSCPLFLKKLVCRFWREECVMCRIVNLAWCLCLFRKHAIELIFHDWLVFNWNVLISEEDFNSSLFLSTITILWVSYATMLWKLSIVLNYWYFLIGRLRAIIRWILASTVF